MLRKISLLSLLVFAGIHLHGQNLLALPDTLSGKSFSLNIHDTSRVFYNGFVTKTYGINAAYLGPTLLLNRGDSVTIHVKNRLMDTTTLHWHGMHVSAKNDGGPHITIAPNSVWSPAFKVRDRASMYWYHSHLHMMTNVQATKGVAGMIIVRDTIERALNLPRTYGLDDFPLAIQSKCFDANKQIVTGNASDSVMMVNGTIDPYLPVPAQVVRFRLLNASSERVYNIGFQGNLVFQLAGTDGGLLNAPVALTRLRLAPGERAQILIDLTGKTGQSLDLMSFASELPNAVYGAAQPGMGPGQTIPGYSANVLNGANFRILKLNVAAPTPSPVSSVPATLVANTPWPVSSATGFRSLTFTPLNPGPGSIQGPFVINGTPFNMSVVNYTIPYNNIEVWTLTNQSPISHPFHIHDTQFYITEIAGAAPPPSLAGRKDVVLVAPGQTLKFITRFENFCDDEAMYMYHCHMLTHEDDGMMGQFIVKCPEVTDVGIEESESTQSKKLIVYPNPSAGKIFIRTGEGTTISEIRLLDASGRQLLVKAVNGESESSLDVSRQLPGIYLLEVRSSGGVRYKKINIDP